MKDIGRIVIVGAGPCGLGAVHRLEELGYDDFVLLEVRPTPGGLASSYVDDAGFTWDVGGHVGFSHYDHYDRVLDATLPDGWLEHQRESWIRFRDRWIPYPFQNNLHRLSPDDCELALRGLEDVIETADLRGSPPENLARWIDATFGEGIGDLFLRPYNRKVWGYPLESLDAGWIGERVAVPDLETLRRQILDNRDDVSWGPNRTFRFPLEGGTGALWTALAGRLDPHRLCFGQEVSGIDLDDRIITTRRGRRERFEALISTMPLSRFCRLCSGLSPVAEELGERLVHSSVYIHGLGIVGPQPASLRRKCWMYFPHPESPYHRVTVFSNYSPHHVPAGSGAWSLLLEISETPHRAVDRDRIEALDEEALRRDGLLGNENRVVSSWIHYERYGYPTPFLGRDQVLGALRSELESCGVFSRGRFGAWKYEVSNQDHSFMQGVEVVDRLLEGSEEPTLDNSTLVNSGAFKTTGDTPS